MKIRSLSNVFQCLRLRHLPHAVFVMLFVSQLLLPLHSALHLHHTLLPFFPLQRRPTPSHFTPPPPLTSASPSPPQFHLILFHRLVYLHLFLFTSFSAFASSPPPLPHIFTSFPSTASSTSSSSSSFSPHYFLPRLPTLLLLPSFLPLPLPSPILNPPLSLPHFQLIFSHCLFYRLFYRHLPFIFRQPLLFHHFSSSASGSPYHSTKYLTSPCYPLSLHETGSDPRWCIVAICGLEPPSSPFKSISAYLWVINPFQPDNPFSTDELPRTSTFHQLWPLQLGLATPHRQVCVVRIRKK